MAEPSQTTMISETNSSSAAIELTPDTAASKTEQVAEVGKGSGLMGGAWKKVISRRRGATCSVQVISHLKDSKVAVATTEKEERKFCTGSSVHGQFDALGMQGECVFTMKNDVIIDGAVHDGHFHGVGTLIYPNQARVDGTFHHGTLSPATYTFVDGLVYEVSSWTYCSCLVPDRRFQKEIRFGLRPVCTSLKTQRQPTRTIPEGCYDTGDGFYDPKTKCVTSMTTGQIIRIPTPSETQWITRNCRKAWDENCGYRRSIDKFSDDDVNYAPLLMEKRRLSVLNQIQDEEEGRLKEESGTRIDLQEDGVRLEKNQRVRK